MALIESISSGIFSATETGTGRLFGLREALSTQARGDSSRQTAATFSEKSRQSRSDQQQAGDFSDVVQSFSSRTPARTDTSPRLSGDLIMMLQKIDPNQTPTLGQTLERQQALRIQLRTQTQQPERELTALAPDFLKPLGEQADRLQPMTLPALGTSALSDGQSVISNSIQAARAAQAYANTISRDGRPDGFGERS